MSDPFATLPRGYFGAIVADPPWRFETYSAGGRDRCPDARHYPVMSLADIAALPVGDLAAPDATLFLWTFGTMVPATLDVMARWSFTFKTVGFVWSKPQIGLGYWTRQQCEICLLGTRGKPQRLARDVRQHLHEPRRQHSRKPDAIQARIEQLVGEPYLELFARRPLPGWHSWGDQLLGDEVLNRAGRGVAA